MIRAAENAQSHKTAGTLRHPKSWRDAFSGLLPEEWAFDPLEDNVLTQPDSAQAWFELANEEAQRGYFEDAIDNYTSAIDLRRDFAEAHYGRGCAYISRRDYIAAIDDLSRAIEINPEFVAAYSQRGFAKERMLLYEEAIQDHNLAFTLKGRPVREKPRRSLISEMIGRITRAAQKIADAAMEFISAQIRTQLPKKKSRKKRSKKQTA